MGFVLDRLLGLFRRHLGGEVATLDHEVLDHAVEDGAVVMLGIDISKKVGHRFRGLAFIELNGDLAVVGVNQHLGSSKSRNSKETDNQYK